MNCREVQDTILDALIDRRALPPAVGAHLADCATCAAFATRQTALDGELRQMLVAPVVGARLRTAVLERIRAEKQPVWRDGLPDLVHFASCGLMTVVSALTLPFNPTLVIAVGVGATLLSHAVLTTLQGTLEAAGDSGV